MSVVGQLPRIVLHCLWWLTLPLFCLTIPLGLIAKRLALKMPEAAGDRAGTTGGGQVDSELAPLDLLMIGESPVAGVGVDGFQDSITVRVASHMSSISGEVISWKGIGYNGIRLARLLEILRAQPMPQARLVIWLGGVNDTTGLTRLAAWRRQVTCLGELFTESGSGKLVFCPVPPLHQFSGIPQPLRFQLGLRARMLDIELARVCRKNGWRRLDLEISSAVGLLAADGYHPSASGADRMGLMIASAVLESGTNPGRAVPEG